MTRLKFLPFQVFLMASMIVLTGCSNVKPKGSVSGKVMTGGKPVTAGDLIFVGADDAPLKVSIDPEGNYMATGLIVGTYQVGVETANFKKLTAPPAKMKTEALRPVYVAIPKKYESPKTSGLTVEITTSEKKWDINCD